MSPDPLAAAVAALELTIGQTEPAGQSGPEGGIRLTTRRPDP